MTKRCFCVMVVAMTMIVTFDGLFRKEYHKFIKEQHRRKRLLKNACGRYQLPYGRQSSFSGSRRQLFHQMGTFTSDQGRNKVLFCEVPKTGTENWLKVFISESQNRPIDRIRVDDHSSDIFERLDHKLLSTDYLGLSDMKENNEIFRGLKHGDSWDFQVLNVRHPLARLHSVWMDLFNNSSVSTDENIMKIFKYQEYDQQISFYENSLSLKKKSSNSRVSYQAFLEWLAKDFDSVDRFGDVQWARISDLCAPCVTNYNVFVKDEDSQEFLTRTLRKIGINKALVPEFPRKDGEKHENFARFYDELVWLYRDFYEMPEAIICGIFNKYKLDFHLFGYRVKPFLFEYTTCDFTF